MKAGSLVNIDPSLAPWKEKKWNFRTIRKTVLHSDVRGKTSSGVSLRGKWKDLPRV